MSSLIRSLPEDLKAFRRKHSLSQSSLARELNVSRTTIYRWETGKSSIPCVMPVALRGLRHIFESRKSAKRRSLRIKMMKDQDRISEREKTLEKLPSKIKDALNVRG